MVSVSHSSKRYCCWLWANEGAHYKPHGIDRQSHGPENVRIRHGTGNAFPSLYESQFYTLWLGLINKRVSVRQLTGKRRLTPIISGRARHERLSLQPRLTHLNQTGYTNKKTPLAVESKCGVCRTNYRKDYERFNQV